MSGDRFEQALQRAPVVAILRGITPATAVAVGASLLEAGIRIMEVPLNSPEPLASISRLREAFGDAAVIGAGTVLRARAVDAVRAAGGELVVAPNTDAGVIRRCHARGVVPLPGFASPSEACAAIAAGARRLKLFPASALGTGMLRAVREVLPAGTAIFAVGGIGPGNAGEWLAAGAAGVGVGSALYAPGDAAAAVAAKAAALIEALAAGEL